MNQQINRRIQCFHLHAEAVLCCGYLKSREGIHIMKEGRSRSLGTDPETISQTRPPTDSGIPVPKKIH